MRTLLLVCAIGCWLAPIAEGARRVRQVRTPEGKFSVVAITRNSRTRLRIRPEADTTLGREILENLPGRKQALPDHAHIVLPANGMVRTKLLDGGEAFDSRMITLDPTTRKRSKQLHLTSPAIHDLIRSVVKQLESDDPGFLQLESKPSKR